MFAVERATLIIAKGSFVLELTDQELQYRSSQPNTTTPINLFWFFDEPVNDVLGTACTIVLQVKEGDVPREVHISYTRVDGA